jgi:spore germination protein YaaH
MDVFTEVSPFAYSVNPDGTLVDRMKITEEPWTSALASARAKKVKIIPSILWSDADNTHKVLRNYFLRMKHEKEIMRVVAENNFDGIDIDYEGKKAETRKYFSYFLQELSVSLHKKNKILVCTIEPRTPLDSRFKNIPADIEYSNDYYSIGKYCDRVRIMAYDQAIIDLKLNEEKGKERAYAPVADPAWVKKVIRLSARAIPLNKIVIGVPTYGYEFEVVKDRNWYRYKRLHSVSQAYALDLAAKQNAKVERNIAGELSFAYTLATTTNATTTVPFRLVWWSDASAIADKIALAKNLGVRGVAIFKIDGGEDPLLWEKLK